ncbi:hypothetical protein BCY86_03145 [Pajaroellobacter abortibovis]|uniref:Uncharacterized protein n=1 Tax=Pajaroellobacter abortibovis TaxID=1882918 RepID=A0A1L6MW78_9BACT|nr:hypothetical protein BCY86_03145 [Pajaroellobacter abortibovis]
MIRSRKSVSYGLFSSFLIGSMSLLSACGSSRVDTSPSSEGVIKGGGYQEGGSDGGPQVE